MDKFVVIDLETTGHSVEDKIIDIGIVVVQENKIIQEYTTLINPELGIPPFISNLTGIFNEDVVDKPVFIDKAPEIIELFKESYLVAHNVSFDLSFLNEELRKNDYEPLNNPVLDTVELAQILFPGAPGYKLSQLAEYFQLEHQDPHRALSDAYVTAEVLLILKKKIDTLPYETIIHLLKLEQVLHSNLYHLLRSQLQKLEFTKEKNPLIDSYEGLAFKKISMPVDQENYDLPSFGDCLDIIYEENGTLESKLQQYEKRVGQREMSEHIFDAFQANKHALIEAGTGTGKTLAYLIPAIHEAVDKQERIVISTYTTQLQSQLLEEEIPLVKKVLPFSFKASLLKGKSHYISLEKFNQALNSGQKENYGVTLTMAMLLVWLIETETGDIDEIQLPSSGYSFFKSISTASEGYVDPRSPWFFRSYYQKARKNAEQADVIITNHALLCTDMFNDYRFLPSYQKAIVDEAHHLETTASRHYGLKLDYVTMQYTLNKIGTTDESQWLGKVLTTYPNAQRDLSFQQWNSIFQDVKHEIDEWFKALFQYVLRQKRDEKSLSDIGRIQYRFDESKEVEDKWQVIKDIANRLIFYFRDLIHLLSMLDEYFESQGMVSKYDRDDLNGHLQNLQQFIDHIEKMFIIEGQVQQIKWIEAEMHGAQNSLYLYSEPKNISKHLTEHFFLENKSIVLTSATLTIRDSFSYIKKRLGLLENDVAMHQIDSPFSYHDQVQLMVPDDFPDITTEDFIYSTCEAILSLAEVTKGRMLVLFTSYEMLRKAHHILKETIDLDKYMLISQGISSGSRARLKKNFQTFQQAILLGTSSFWEGVDIPGKDLSCLVIVRLPFQPPNHPVYEVKSSMLKQEGKNAFFELSLPEAVIRFKQGFGRLIRSTNDRGIVFVCDARIMKARYGNFFTTSIPNVPMHYDSTYQLIQKAENWF